LMEDRAFLQYIYKGFRNRENAILAF
jgi:hypothetical protein